jgi:proteasome activator subunit 3 (PA28 gamma)
VLLFVVEGLVATWNRMTSKKETLTPSTDEIKQQVNGLKEGVVSQAHKIVHEIMPRKILELNELFTKHPSFNAESSKVLILEGLDEELLVQNSQAAKKRKFEETLDENGHQEPQVPCNRIILELLAIIKREILELIEMINTVKIWIQLNIPRIEDGNNFGVSIQEETVSELSRAEDSGFAVLESMTKYFVTRAKLVTKVIKHPSIEDYRQCVIELDDKEFVNLRFCALDLRNNYAILHDIIIKNLEKLKTPRSANHMASIF